MMKAVNTHEYIIELNDKLQKAEAELAALEAENKKLDGLLSRAQHNIVTLKADLSKVSQDILNLTMAYTKLMAENAVLRDPWTRIEEGRPERLPPGDEYPILISYHHRDGGTKCTDALAFRLGNRVEFANFDGDVEYENVYAWQPWPDPAPYKDEEE